MGGISWGSSPISKVYWGNSEVSKIYYGDTEIYSAQEQLAAPTLSLSGDTLMITDNSEQAESFDLYVDGVYAANVPTQSGYTVNVSMVWGDIGDDYAGKVLYVIEGDASSSMPVVNDPFYELEQNPNATTTGQFSASGQITLVYTGSLSANITSATLNGTPISFTNYDNLDTTWYYVANITENSTLYMECYGYD